MNLGDLIARLETANPQQVVPHGFHNPHSYRGDYMDLAFEPAVNITVADMLEAARSAVGTTYEGYKGGDFRMDVHDWCWLSEEGSASGETISPLLLDLMLAEPAVVPVSAAAPQTAWIDGHPQLEAIAASVYERCTTGDGGIVHDDPRNIAVAALAAVLPPHTDQAAVLDETAALLEAQSCTCGCRRAAEFVRQRAAVIRAADARRLAAETAGPVAQATTDGVKPRQCPAIDIVYGRCIRPVHDGGECFHGGQPIRIDEETDEGSLCGSEFPGDDNFVGQLCGLPKDHFGEHRCDERMASGYIAKLRWPAAPAVETAGPETQAARTPCSDPPCDEGPGEPCDRHEQEQAHADGLHEDCGVTCEVQFPTEQLRNFILAKGYPGASGMLDELLRRAAVGSPAAVPAAVQTEEARNPAIVAFRSRGGRLLRCLAHTPGAVAVADGEFDAVTAEDLPDGGICTYPDCGVDVLIPQEPTS